MNDDDDYFPPLAERYNEYWADCPECGGIRTMFVCAKVEECKVCGYVQTY